MSEIRIRVGSELVQLNAPRDEPFPVDLVEREIAQSRQRQAGTVTLTQVAGKFVERTPRSLVDAVLWTGDNWDLVSEWLESRSESVKLFSDIRPPTIVAWDGDDGRLTCPAPGWLVQKSSGEVSFWSTDKFNKCYRMVDENEVVGIISRNARMT